MEATIEKNQKKTVTKKTASKKKLVEKAETVIVDNQDNQVKNVENEPVVEKQEVAAEQSAGEQNATEVNFESFCDELVSLSERIVECSQTVKDFSFLTKDNRARFDTLLTKKEKADTAFSKAIRNYFLTTIQVQEKSIGHKNKSSNGPKKDSSKAAVHIPHNVQPYLLKFMGHDPASSQKVSRNQALNAITSFVKTEQEKNNPDIVVEGNKKYFKLIGSQAELFSSIGKTMEEKQKKLVIEIKDMKGTLSPEDTKIKTKKEEELAKITSKLPIPSEICYTEIMGYMTHCFIKE